MRDDSRILLWVLWGSQTLPDVFRGEFRPSIVSNDSLRASGVPVAGLPCPARKPRKIIIYFHWFSPPLPFSPYFPTNPASAKVGFLRRYKLFFVRVFSRYKVYCSCAREQHRGHAGTLLPIFKQHCFIFRHIFGFFHMFFLMLFPSLRSASLSRLRPLTTVQKVFQARLYRGLSGKIHRKKFYWS